MCRQLPRGSSAAFGAKKKRFHTCGGPRRRPCLGEGRGRRIIAADWNLEPDFGNLPYPEKVTGTNRSDLGKIDKIYDIFTFCETVHRNQNLEPLPKMARREPKMTTLSQFFTRKVPVKLAK